MRIQTAIALRKRIDVFANDPIINLATPGCARMREELALMRCHWTKLSRDIKIAVRVAIKLGA